MTVVFTSKASESKMEENFQAVIHLNMSCSIISVFVLVSALCSLHKGKLGNVSGRRRQIFSSQKFNIVPSTFCTFCNT